MTPQVGIDEIAPPAKTSPDSLAQGEVSQIQEATKAEHKHRDRFGKLIFAAVVIWYIVVLLFVLMQGFKWHEFTLSEPTMLALIGSTTANVVGLLYIVVRYYFRLPA